MAVPSGKQVAAAKTTGNSGGSVTAADVTAQATAIGQTISPGLAAAVAQDLTTMGLTSATYRAGVRASVSTMGRGIAPLGLVTVQDVIARAKVEQRPMTAELAEIAAREYAAQGITSEAYRAGEPEVTVAPTPVPSPIGVVTAQDVIAQVEAIGQTITPELATTVARDLTSQGLTPATYVAGVQASQSYRVSAGEKATPAGEIAAVQEAQAAVVIPAPPRVLQVSTVTQATQERTGLPVGSHYATLEGGIIEPISDAEWEAKSKSYGAIQTRVAPDIAVAELNSQIRAFTSTWRPLIKGDVFIGSKGQYDQYIKESELLGTNIGEFNTQMTQLQKLAEIKQEEFEARHIRLGDDKWVDRDVWDEIPRRYQSIGTAQGLDAMIVTMEEDQSRLTATGGLERAREAKGWFNKLKAFLDLTPEGISEAELRYLTAPPMPEGEDRGPSSREMLASLVPLLGRPSTPMGIGVDTVQRVLVALNEARKKKDLNEIYMSYLSPKEKKAIETLTAGLSIEAARIAPQVRGAVQRFGEPLPPGIEQAVKFGGSVVLGAASAPIYSAIVTGHLTQVAWAPDKIKSLTDLGTGLADFFISIPATVAAQPALALGEYTGLFVVGPGGMLKIVKSIGARGVPSYIPTRGMGIEYSVARVPASWGPRGAVITAVNRGIIQAMRSKTGTATVNIGGGKIKLKIRSTPVSEVVGPALYHATPALTNALKKGKVTGTLYTSPHLAVRFAESAASGMPQSNPAILMIFTKSGKVKWSPTTNLYKAAKEMEVVYGHTQLIRVKSLWARLTFGKAGDFITVRNGKIIPIYRFKEPGAIAPRINLADLVAIRVKTIQASLADLVKGKKGFEIIKESRAKILHRIMERARREIKKGKKTTEAYDIAYRAEVRRMARQSPRLYAQLNRLYRATPEVFERTYREQLEREFNQITRERPFVAGERITPRQRAEIGRGIIPREYRRFIPERERPSERTITELRRAREQLPRERIARVEEPRRGVPIVERPPIREPRIRRPPVRRPPIIPPLPPPPVTPTLLPLKAKIVGKQARLPEGSIAFRQGAFWKYLSPPWDQVKLITLRSGITPMGAKNTHLRTPQETVQKIGEPKAPVPESLSADLGIADLEITNYGQNIEYAGKGLETNVGGRVGITTKGLSVPSRGIGRPALGDIYPAKSVSRLDMDKEEPPRKGERKKAKAEVEGISRPKIAEDTKRMEEGTYLDEDKEWLESLKPSILRKKPVNRPISRKRIPRRSERRDNTSPTMGSIRI